MLTCLSRSVSVRSHGRLASLKHPVLSPPPLWNTPNKTPPKSSTNSYSKAASFLPFFSFLSSASSRNPFKYHPSLSQYLYRPVSLFLSETLSPISFSLSLSLTTRPHPPDILAAFPSNITYHRANFFHHVHQLFRNQIRDLYNYFLFYSLSLFLSFACQSLSLEHSIYIIQDHAIKLWKSISVKCLLVIKETIYICIYIDFTKHADIWL